MRQTPRLPRIARSPVLLCALCALFARPVSAAEAVPTDDPPAGHWPQWRGANRDNVSADTGLLTEWPEGGPPLSWKATGLGTGYAGVSVAAGRVFTMGDGPDAAHVRALRESDGQPLWSAKVGPPAGGGGFPGPRCTPAVDTETGLLYALGQHGDLVCLEVETGHERWRKHLANDLAGVQIARGFTGKEIDPWGYSESPLLDGDRLVCTPGGPEGTVAALDKATGQVLWRSKGLTDTAVYTSRTPAEVGGRRQYVVLTGFTVAGVAADTGQVLWQVRRMGGTATVPTPVVSGDLVYVTSGYYVGCNLFRVTAGRETVQRRAGLRQQEDGQPPRRRAAVPGPRLRLQRPRRPDLHGPPDRRGEVARAQCRPRLGHLRRLPHLPACRGAGGLGGAGGGDAGGVRGEGRVRPAGPQRASRVAAAGGDGREAVFARPGRAAVLRCAGEIG